MKLDLTCLKHYSFSKKLDGLKPEWEELIKKQVDGASYYDPRCTVTVTGLSDAFKKYFNTEEDDYEIPTESKLFEEVRELVEYAMTDYICEFMDDRFHKCKTFASFKKEFKDYGDEEELRVLWKNWKKGEGGSEWYEFEEAVRNDYVINDVFYNVENFALQDVLQSINDEIYNEEIEVNEIRESGINKKDAIRIRKIQLGMNGGKMKQKSWDYLISGSDDPLPIVALQAKHGSY